MARVKFEYLNINPQRRFKNSGFTQKENTGLDTETYNGYVKLICDDSGRHKDIDELMDIIAFLTHARYRLRFNWFYNIQFDFESIIKYLDKGELTDLYINGELEYNNYIITYISKKFFSIKDRNKQYFYFYDLYNFLDTSLEKASRKFLGDSKIGNIDAKRLNIEIDYWEENKDNIVKYCIYDAVLTKRLADYFWGIIYNHLSYYPKRPFSKGKISEEYFLTNCYIPQIDFIPKKVLEYSYNSYFGGRFELLKRGYFEDVYNYDIKSAYPAQIAGLIDYSKGKWNRTTKFNEDAYAGFYLCKLDILEGDYAPVVKKLNDLNIYPNGRFKQYLTKNEIAYIMAHFENSTVKIVSGYEFYPHTLNYPFKREIERLYEWKEKEEDEDIKYVIKIILNALYGKFIQVTGDNLTGKIFNPIYASTITANTRLKLFELAEQKPDSLIAFSTDSIASTEKLKVSSKPKLGDFSLDFKGEGVYILSDVYTLWNNTKNKNRIRGFSHAKEKDNDSDTILLKDILKDLNGTIYNYTTYRPYHLGECLIHNKKLNVKQHLNVFSQVEKTIDINGDTKRVWTKNFASGKDCLRETISSLPIMV